jgi:hypothetical protein
MPHLYPMGSIFLFLPFGIILEHGVAPIVVYKMEILLFLVVAHLGFYYFLTYFLKLKVHVSLKFLLGYMLYITLIVYSANGMFDSVAFLFSIFAMVSYLGKRYDIFILLIAVSATFQYQAGILLSPLVVAGLARVFHQHGVLGTIKNWKIVSAVSLICVDGFTGLLSAPFLANIRPQLVLNGINLFNPHSQVSWSVQFFAIFLTLTMTLLFAMRLFEKNSLLSVSVVAALLPCLVMPYFQVWYLPFFFFYVLFPSNPKETKGLILWLVFIIVIVSFGGFWYNPITIVQQHFKIVWSLVCVEFLNFFS